MKFFRTLILIITALMLTVSLFITLFDRKGEKADAETLAPGTENTRDYSSFAEGTPHFSLAEINVSAKSAVLCTDSGMLLYEKQADVPLPMASITKVMTATVVLDTLNVRETNKTDALKREINVDKKAVGIEGSSVYLRENERVTLEMLLSSIMLESANDAATAIAYALFESEEAFVKAMNDKAKALCMESTVFKNPHGLSDDGHYTTARDFARLMSYAIENPVFCQLISTKKAVYPSADGEMTRVLTNHNRLLTTYKNMIGGKTGYTKISGRTLVTAAEKDGTRLICVTINAPDDWNDHETLFEKGFSAVKTDVFTKDNLFAEIPVAGGDTVTLRCSINESVRVTVKKETEITVKIYCPGIVFAPITDKEALGRAEIYAGEEKISEYPLLAETDVKSSEKTGRITLFGRLKAFFKD